MARKQGAYYKGKISGADALARAIAKARAVSDNTERIAQRIDAAAHARAASELLNRRPETLTREQARAISIGCHAALEDLRTGRPDEEQIGWLVNAANLALLLAEQGLGDDYMAEIKAGQDALMRMIARHGRTARYALDGPGLLQLAELLRVHDAQLESPDCTDHLMLTALAEMRRRVEAKHVLEVRAA